MEFTTEKLFALPNHSGLVVDTKDSVFRYLNPQDIGSLAVTDQNCKPSCAPLRSPPKRRVKNWVFLYCQIKAFRNDVVVVCYPKPSSQAGRHIG